MPATSLQRRMRLNCNRRVRVWWEGNGAWFSGTTREYDPTSCCHLVVYDEDRSQQWEPLEKRKVRYEWLDEGGSGARASGCAAPPPTGRKGAKQSCHSAQESSGRAAEPWRQRLGDGWTRKEQGEPGRFAYTSPSGRVFDSLDAATAHVDGWAGAVRYSAMRGAALTACGSALRSALRALVRAYPQVTRGRHRTL